MIGAGVVGLAAASACARRGHRTVVLDRFEEGHTRGSSHGAERILRFAYTDPLYVELTKRSVPAWAALAEMSDAALLDPVGCIDVGDADEVEALAAALAAAGIPHERVTAQEASRRWPGVAAPDGALHQWTAGVLRAEAALSALATSVSVAGGQIRRSVHVGAVLTADSGRASVTLADGEVIEADVVILAAGAWARSIVPAAIDLPLITVTEELVGFFGTKSGVAQPPCFVARRQPFLYGLPTSDGLYKLGEHGTGAVVDPDRRDGPPVDLGARLERLSEHASVWLPGLDPRPLSWTTCLYASTPTDDPVVERHGSIVVAAGFGGHGFKFAPAAGEIAADLVEGRTGPTQLTAAGSHTPVPPASGHR